MKLTIPMQILINLQEIKIITSNNYNKIKITYNKLTYLSLKIKIIKIKKKFMKNKKKILIVGY
jgi:hypothetical protein